MKKKFLALAMASAVMLTGAGYAYWTDQLTVNNTVTTGELNIKFVSGLTGGGDAKEWPGYVYSDYKANPDPNAASVDTVVTDKVVTATMGNLYPGSHGWVEVKAQNVGTIPVVFDNAAVAVTGSDKLAEKLTFAAGWTIYDQNGDVKETQQKDWGNGTGLDTLDDELNRILADKRLEPGETIAIGLPEAAAAELGLSDGESIKNQIFFNLPSTVVNADDIENQKIGVEIKLNWKQHNDVTAAE